MRLMIWQIIANIGWLNATTLRKTLKKAIIEFEKVFTYAGTDKDDDAQLKNWVILPEYWEHRKSKRRISKAN